METAGDKEIMELFQTDRERAFNLFFRQYYTRLCIYAVQLTDDFSESEDIVQGFFVSFWEKERYESITDNLKGYAYLSVRNAALKYIEGRKRSAFEELPADDESLLLISDELSEAERIQKEKALERALNALPEQERKALYGVVVEEKSYKAMATELNISTNTLKTYLSRAMKKLRKNDKLLLLMVASLQGVG